MKYYTKFIKGILFLSISVSCLSGMEIKNLS
jgi:hypothetical protein